MVKPYKKFKSGSITATIWEKVAEKAGKQFTVYNIEIVRNYMSEKEWKKTSSFNLNDLPRVIDLANQAYSALTSIEIVEKDAS